MGKKKHKKPQQKPPRGDVARGGEEFGDLQNVSAATIERQRELLEAATAAAAGAEAATAAAGGAEAFTVRRVDFLGRQVPVLLQSRNGPCALLAVANGLLLRGTLKLKDGEDAVSSEWLLSQLAHLCETLNARAAEENANVREAVSQVVDRLPHLLDGLVLNCRFGSCSDFEYTADLGLFDMFGLQLYHAWVAPEVAEVASSWNALSEYLAACAELRAMLDREGRPREPGEDEILARGLWLEEWLEEAGAQATPRGLRELLEAVGEREVCVLFRNNHFCTIYKPQPGELCALLTDEVFSSIAAAVWESVEDDCGPGRILGADFRPAAPEALERQAAGSRLAKAQQEVISPEARAALVQLVEELGFSREQAEAGLAAVDWSSAEAAVEALLDAQGEVPQSGWKRSSRASR